MILDGNVFKEVFVLIS